MGSTKLITVALALLFSSSTALASFARPVPAATYQGARVEPGDALILSRLCAGETGVHRTGWVESCAAQVGIVARRARRSDVSVGAMARLYSAALKPGPHSRPWVMALDATGRRPPGFPSRASWADYAPRWERLRWLVRSQLAGDVADPCPIADHFGSIRLDGHRANRARMVRVCPHVSRRQGLWVSQRKLARLGVAK